MAVSLQPEPAVTLQHGDSAESIASSLSDSASKKTVFVANRFNLLRWTTAHKFITEYCDVQLQQPPNSNNPELYDNLEDMIKDVFTGDQLPNGQTLLTDLPKLCTDERLRSFKVDWLNNLDFDPESDEPLYTREYANDRTRFLQVLAAVSVKKHIGRELNLTDKISEAIQLVKLEEFIDSCIYLLGNNHTSEDAYKKCFERFLGILSLQFMAAPPACTRWQYLRPAIAWSYSGKIVAEPDGSVLTRKGLQSMVFHAFAYVDVKKKTNEPVKKAGTCLGEGEARPKVPWLHIQEILDKVLPQHFLELLLSANDTLFQSFKKEGSEVQRYFTKIGIIQQGMMVNVVILKICEDDFWWLVPGEEKGEKLHKECEVSKKSGDCPAVATENVPNRKDSVPEMKKNPNEVFSSDSDQESEDDITFVEEDIDSHDSVKEKMFMRSLRSSKSRKKVRFQDLHLDDDSSSEKKHPLLFISKTYYLLNSQDRYHLANGLLVLEAIADDMLSKSVKTPK